MEEIGPEGHKEWKNIYTLKQLLDPEFRLPLSKDEEDFVDLFAGVEGLKFDEVK